MNRKQLIKKYIEFFKSKEHKEIPNESLVPENDPTALFISAGMHPLVPYLLGQPHPLGKRLVNVQRCIRTGDIEEVGDTYHHTFFEMLGNWSLGDYWKKEAIEFSFEFLTKVLKIPVEKLAVSIFGGDKDFPKIPKDNESAEIWKSLGIPKERIAPISGGVEKGEDNWWGPVGRTGPCGPSTEMFCWRGNSKQAPKEFNLNESILATNIQSNWVEIWNDVLMQYVKDKRVILVDGMYCIYDKEFKPNKELLDFINNLNTHTILTVKGFREKGRELIKNYDKSKDTNWEAFSLEEKGTEKNNPEYFKSLLKKFNLDAEEVIYFDHKKESVETAKKLGILSKYYIDTKSIKKFVEDNLWAYLPAKQKNIDTGMGLERTLAILNGLDDDYLTETFLPIIKQIEKFSGKKYKGNERAMRIIADHVKASVFIIADGVLPSNTEQGYVLRRLIRRAVRYGKSLGMKNFTSKIAKPVFNIYNDYEHLQKNKNKILNELENEEKKFSQTLERGENIIKQHIIRIKHAGEPEVRMRISGKTAFLLYQSYGFPLELTKEIAEQYKIAIDEKGFQKEFQKHQKLSRTATEGRFKSGLADDSEATTKLHTATHLLLAALRIVLKDKNIIQKGSNITPQRLRFDFSFPRKLTKEELKNVEDLVNAQIQKSCEVIRKEMSPEQAKKKGALGIFDKKYGEKVSVYEVGDFSKEICAGPHVKNTCKLGHFRIKKEESSSAGVRRIKAVLE